MSAQNIQGNVQTSAAVIEEVLDALAADEMAGREANREGGKRARSWLQNWLTKQGFSPLGDPETPFLQAYEGGANVVAMLYPKGNSKGNPTVLIGAHYDHFGNQCRDHALAASQVCNGAADNAAGVAAALAAFQALVGRVDTPVALVLWDSEEKGMLGSNHFVTQPCFATEDLRLLINLDILGLNLFKGMENDHMVIGAETGGSALVADVRNSNAGLSLHLLSYVFGYRRSDLTIFYDAGFQTPAVFFSDGDGSMYHTKADERDRVNQDKVVKVAQTLTGLVLAAAARDKAYGYVPPPKLGHDMLPQFDDVNTLHGLLEKILAHADQNRLQEPQRQRFESQLEALKEIQRKGKGGFAPQDAVLLRQVAAAVIQASRTLPFIP